MRFYQKLASSWELILRNELMNFKLHHVSVLAIIISSGLFSGCASRYEIRDPQTGTIYHTESVDRERGGAIIFDDATSGREVTIQNSEIKKLSKSEYEAATEADSE